MKAIIEGLLFLNGEDGLTLENISSIIGKNEEETKKLIKELYDDYQSSDRGIQIEYLGNSFKLTTKKEHKEFYKKLVSIEQNSPLTQTSLETLAIIAYNGPITRVEIDEIRGVNSTYIIRKLLMKGLIEDAGKSESPGKPRLYKTTSRFLDYFGLGSIDELPKIEPIQNDEIDTEENLFKSKYIENDMH